MSLQAIPPRPPLTVRSLLRFVHDRNPFYLLSALSMFVGYRLVIAALNTPAGAWRPLLGLIVTMHVYECVMIALALYLIVRRGLVRDGWILLGIEALFLVDLTNLNAELFTALPRLGSAVSAACFALAVLKVGVVLRVLRLRITPATALYGAAQLALLFALPGLFRLLRTDTATVPPMRLYAVWWLVGGLVAAGAAVVRRDPRNDGHAMAALPRRLYLLVPLASLLVHLASENRVYWVHFEPANLAPLLLAAVVAVHRGRTSPAQVAASLVLVGLAVLASMVPAESRGAMSAPVLGVDLTPWRVALLASSATLAFVAWRHQSWAVTAVIAGCGLLAAMGPSLPEIGRRLARAAEWAWDAAWQLVPQTPLQWGYAAIGGAFVLLGVGAVFSLRSGTRPGPVS